MILLIEPYDTMILLWYFDTMIPVKVASLPEVTDQGGHPSNAPGGGDEKHGNLCTGPKSFTNRTPVGHRVVLPVLSSHLPGVKLDLAYYVGPIMYSVSYWRIIHQSKNFSVLVDYIALERYYIDTEHSTEKGAYDTQHGVVRWRGTQDYEQLSPREVETPFQTRCSNNIKSYEYSSWYNRRTAQWQTSSAS